MAKRNPSIEDIFDRRYEDLLSFVRYRIRDAAEVRDIAQEAFLRLLRRDREDLIERPEAYLFRIAANLAHEHRLRSKRLMYVPHDRLNEEEDCLSPETRAEDQGRLASLSEALSKLPPMPRAVLVLQRRDGLTYDEIAEHLGITKHMVKKYLARAMSHCRAALLEHDDK